MYRLLKTKITKSQYMFPFFFFKRRRKKKKKKNSMFVECYWYILLRAALVKFEGDVILVALII